MKKVLFLVCCFLLGLTACSKDKDSDGGDGGIIGKWNLVAKFGQGAEVQIPEGYERYIEFNADGTGVLSSKNPGGIFTIQITWTAEGNEITITYQYDEYTDVMKASLKGDTLHLFENPDDLEAYYICKK